MGTYARIKPATEIETWSGWPKDVVGKLLHWNKGLGQFECCGCKELCQSHKYGAAVLSGQPLCDDCLVKYARGQLTLTTAALRYTGDG